MEIGVALNNELEVRISEAFCVFDTHGDKYIDTRNVGHVLRFLGCVPTEREVNEVIAATESTEYPGESQLTKFMAHVSQILMAGQMKPSSTEKLFEAFQVLDPENHKYLTKEYFGKLMLEEGDTFTEEELEDMWPVAIDPITGNIPYTLYINQLKHKGPIYEVAAAVKAEMAQAEHGRKK
ncbi:dynein regulatory complex protein 8 [Drosophila guanche]|uniref:Blast:EF-hand calcium-binding domain-containing protein 2 n=1 Tax=Drosophila guanche TaxID=7266 RepID=A0A3B0JQE5_DROGU|nr:dynein regulatory complex protein 8 [Drosophila guanche]SPP74881.1 blast:EF-hand calcium-binding domain-containing protein 2 [Drosophila guanche]